MSQMEKKKKSWILYFQFQFLALWFFSTIATTQLAILGAQFEKPRDDFQKLLRKINLL